MLADGDRLIALGVTAPGDAAEVVTVTNGKDGLASAKVTALSEYPQKGRATGGVRAHRFLTGESQLALAWVGVGPAKAASSGVMLTQSIGIVGPNYAAVSAALAVSPEGEKLF